MTLWHSKQSYLASASTPLICWRGETDAFAWGLKSQGLQGSVRACCGLTQCEVVSLCCCCFDLYYTSQCSSALLQDSKANNAVPPSELGTNFTHSGRMEGRVNLELATWTLWDGTQVMSRVLIAVLLFNHCTTELVLGLFFCQPLSNTPFLDRNHQNPSATTAMGVLSNLGVLWSQKQFCWAQLKIQLNWKTFLNTPIKDV